MLYPLTASILSLFKHKRVPCCFLRTVWFMKKSFKDQWGAQVLIFEKPLIHRCENWTWPKTTNEAACCTWRVRRCFFCGVEAGVFPPRWSSETLQNFAGPSYKTIVDVLFDPRTLKTCRGCVVFVENCSFSEIIKSSFSSTPIECPTSLVSWSSLVLINCRWAIRENICIMRFGGLLSDWTEWLSC